jgi:phage-related protein
VFTAIRDFVTTHGTEIQTIMSAVWTAIQNTITNLLTIIQGVINLAMSLIKGDWQGAWNAVVQILTGVWEQMKTVISTAFTVIDTLTGGALSRFGQKLGTMATAVRETLGKALIWLKDTVISPVTSAFQNMSDVIEGIIDAIKRLLDKLPSVSGVKDLLGGLLGGNGGAGQGFGGVLPPLSTAPVGIGMGGGATFNMTVYASGDPQAVQQAVKFGVLDAARAMGVR